MSYPRITLSIATCLSLMLTALTSLAHTSPSSEPHDFRNHKALLIGVDGMQYEKLQEAIEQGMAPNIAKMNLHKSYVGGVVGTSTEQATYSGPGWMTILTGSWVDRHQVDTNNSTLRNQTPSLFKQVKLSAQHRQTASIVSWDTINDNLAEDIEEGYIDLATNCSEIDQCVADKASYELEHGRYDLVFAHFDEPDLTGHDTGFTPKYQQAIQGVDAQIGKLMAALERRKKSYPEEDWLVMVSPDHGRKLPSGSSHGEQTTSEKTTFIAMNKPGNLQLTDPLPDPTDPGHNGLYGYASQADITPTLLNFLGVKPNVAQHTTDGLPLMGPVGVRQFTAQKHPDQMKVTLKWRTTVPSGKPLYVYRDGKYIATLTDRYSEYLDNDVGTSNAAVNYTVGIDGILVSRLVSLQDADVADEQTEPRQEAEQS